MITPHVRHRLIPFAHVLATIWLTIGLAALEGAEDLGALGRLRPEVPVLTVLGAPGVATVAKVHVKVNETVAAGDLLMTLDTSENAKQDLEEARAHLQRVRSQVAHSTAIQELEVKRQKDMVQQSIRAKSQVKENSDSQINVLQQKVKQAEAQANLARANVTANQVLGLQLIKEQELKVRQSALSLALAESRLLAYKQLGGESITPREVEIREFDVDQAKVSHDAAKLAAERIESQTRSANDQAAAEELIAQAGHAMAKAELAQAESSARTSKADAEQGETSAKLLLEAAEARLAQIKDDAEARTANAETGVRQAETALKLTEVRAPYAGTVIDLLAGVGDQVASRPLLRFADLSSMVAECEVHEGDLLKVRIGQTASVSGGALPKETKGEVISVSRVVNNRLRVGLVLVRLADRDAASHLLDHEVSVKINF